MRRRTEALAVLAGLVAATVLLLAPVTASADWETIGGAVTSAEAVPSFDLKNIGGRPYVAYTYPTGSGNHVIAVARLSEDGSTWDRVGPVVNRDPRRDAMRPSLAAGPGGAPWISWTEKDSEDIYEIRAAHLSSTGDSWVEPDGRDWEINYRGPGYGYNENALWSAAESKLVFLGTRPYITVLQNNPVEWEMHLVRLADDEHSWEHVARGLVSSIPGGPDAAVIGGLLHVGGVAGWTGAAVDRLNQDGQRETLGGGWVNSSVKDEYGNSLDGTFAAVAGFGGEAHVLWGGWGDGPPYVSRVVDGAWQLVGGGAIDDGVARAGMSLRTVGGRLYAAWIGHGSPAALRVTRLSDDGGSWIDTPGTVGYPATGGAVLTGIDGVPYAAWTEGDGSAIKLLVAKLDGAPAPIGADDGDGSGPGTDPAVTGVPLLPPRLVGCGQEIDGTPTSDTLAGGSHRDGIRGFAGDDSISGGLGSDCLFGGRGDDSLMGGAGADVLQGREGGDLLRGGDSEDRLDGGSGGDHLYGGADEDLLVGGPGNDWLGGGPGWDTFRAGLGNDRVNAADGRGESVNCGPGVDRVRADRFDRLAGCERVTIVP